jgi:Domain of unknown function (DUF6268)
MAAMTIRHLAIISALASSMILQTAWGAPQSWTGSVAVGSLHEPTTDLDTNGDFSAKGGFVHASFTGPLNESGFVPGVAFDYEYTSYDFADSTVFGTRGPWSDVQHVRLSAPVVLRATSPWRYLLAPTVDFARASGAKSGNALSYGGVLAAIRRVDEARQLGFGISVLNGLEKVRVVPVVVVDWKLSDVLRLVNTPAAGPVGNGVELEYRLSDRWSVAGGAGFKRTRFRLSETGRYADGIGEQRGATAFVHASWRLDARFNVDFYAAGLAGARLRVENADGDRLIQEDFDVSPLFGATLSAQF